MGSLTSKPKVKQPKVVYVPPPATPVTNPATTSTPTTPTNTQTPPPTGENTGAGRAASLLLRDRGRFGTVLTGFRGLLAASNDARPRKTLLGE